jgi:hypothetical protein
LLNGPTGSPDVGAIVDSEERLELFARQHGQGRYQVDEHRSDPFPKSNCSARAWGTVIHQPDGRIALKPFFYGDHVACIVPTLPASTTSAE